MMLIELDDDTTKYLMLLAKAQNIDITEANRRAIATEAYIQSKRKEGYKILLENGKEIRELIFR